MNKYDDIINLPNPTAKKHPRMTMEARAAQFAPFAALTGYDDEVKETARLTDRRIEISEEVKLKINDILLQILENIKNNPKVTITYFIPDKKKTGGKYVNKTNLVKKIDAIKQEIYFIDNTKIYIPEIINIQLEKEE